MSKITASAKGQECQIRLLGICNHDNSTVVWAHANGLAAGKGIGKKSPDILGSYACSACHDAIDRRVTPMGIFYQDIEIAFHEGHQRSVNILIEKGLV